MKTVTLYTDGACSGNPGPGGWGAILEYNGVQKELSGGEINTERTAIMLLDEFRACKLGRVTLDRYSKEELHA